MLGKLAQPPSRPLLAKRFHVEIELSAAIESHVSPLWMGTDFPVQVGVVAGADVLC